MPATQSREDLLGLYKDEIHGSSMGRTMAGTSAGARVVELGINARPRNTGMLPSLPGQSRRPEVHVAIPECLLLGTLRAGVHSHSARFAHIGRLHPHARAAGKSPRASSGTCCCTTRKKKDGIATKCRRWRKPLSVPQRIMACCSKEKKATSMRGMGRIAMQYGSLIET